MWPRRSSPTVTVRTIAASTRNSSRTLSALSSRSCMNIMTPSPIFEAEEVLGSDFFLASSAASFVDSARHLISESYCKIHQRIDIKDLAQRLNLTQDEGEKWIVNLIRDTRVDAKIDYKDGTVIMNHPPQSVYQQVIEKTKGGLFRTQVLTAAVSK
ncbi:unnamed protein product [Tuber melanosporum]|uniref:(Perigord truffle) hypothetical protein n=1 Tax=Tuber melanosporum (strain Mel28) TaxID=656061 RepID=D5GDT5_TUBMM|nr:uncharacterized protein GSTUM_00006263001 [Tuber melanosporum]CAZ82678.1 unnamed protein product [Tuber melanosporum]